MTENLLCEQMRSRDIVGEAAETTASTPLVGGPQYDAQESAPLAAQSFPRYRLTFMLALLKKGVRGAKKTGLWRLSGETPEINSFSAAMTVVSRT